MAYFECCTFDQTLTRFLVLRNIVCQCRGLACVRHSYGTIGQSEIVTLWKTLGTMSLKLYDADNCAPTCVIYMTQMVHRMARPSTMLSAATVGIEGSLFQRPSCLQSWPTWCVCVLVRVCPSDAASRGPGGSPTPWRGLSVERSVRVVAMLRDKTCLLGRCM